MIVNIIRLAPVILVVLEFFVHGDHSQGEQDEAELRPLHCHRLHPLSELLAMFEDALECYLNLKKASIYR